MTYDITVIGAGPAGCAAAITAARFGSRVLLLERGRYPRHRVCGEFVSAESLDVIASLLSCTNRSLLDTAPRVRQCRVFADGVVLCLAIDPPARSIPRFDLDSALWDACVERGIDARQEYPVQAVCGNGPFVVEANGEVFQSKAVVNASGRWSVLTSAATRRLASGRQWVGVKAHFSEPQPSPTVDLYFFAGGYCGVQPVSLDAGGSVGVVNACAMVNAEVATNLSDVVSLHPALHERSRTWKSTTTQVSTSPLVFHKPAPVHRGMLQAGDAATFVDPFIGDGISLALRSGVLAAECLSDFQNGACSLVHAQKEYEGQYMRRLAPVFRASSVLRNLLRAPSAIRRPALSILQSAPAMTRQLVRMTR